MTTPHDAQGEWTRGKPTRACRSLPPVTLVTEETDRGSSDEVWTSGRFDRVGESLAPVTLVAEEVSPALVLRTNGDPAARADAVVDALLKAVAHDRAAGGTGFTRDRSRERAHPGVFTLVLSPNGPLGPDTEARLREVARLVASPTVSADVIPAA
jgi:hypothetical protein